MKSLIAYGWPDYRRDKEWKRECYEANDHIGQEQFLIVLCEEDEFSKKGVSEASH